MESSERITLVFPYNFEPRIYQLPILQALDSGVKRAVWCAHRRSGKDITIFNWVIKKLVVEPMTCFYILPSYAQAKKVIWDAKNNDGQRLIDYYIPNQVVAQKNNQEMKIRFANGSLLQLIGSDNIDSLMGTNPKIVVFSEYALQNPNAWDYIRPILKVNHGTAIFISTPRGRNHFYELYRFARQTDDWFSQKLTIEDTKVLTKEDIEKEKQEGMSEELALQEYYCSFDRGIEGSYYAKLIQKMEKEERISNFVHDPYKVVHTAFDLGWSDTTVILFFQTDGDIIKIIDIEAFNTTTYAQMKKILDEKGYRYGTNLFPHDVQQNDGFTTGCTRKEILEGLGIEVTTVEKIGVSDGIEAVRVLMSSRLYIDKKKCDSLIKALEAYHRDWDDKNKVYGNKPRHDWSSHYCFLGETKIKTSLGDVKIENIRVGDYVQTPFGYRKVLEKHVRNVNEICNVCIGDKIIFSCTKEHQIFTQKGLIQTDALRYSNLEYYNWIRIILWKIFGFFSKEHVIKGFKKTILSQKMEKQLFLTDFFIDPMEYIIEEQSPLAINQALFIEQFGSIIKVRFQKIWKFIIKIMTKTTTQLKIWKSFLEESINDFIPFTQKVGLNPKNVLSFSKNIPKKLNYGISQKKEENGINNTQKKVYHHVKEQDIQRNVMFVRQNIMENKSGKDFVQINAKQNIVSSLKSIMKKGIAQFVLKSLKLINILSKQHVVTNVELKKCNTLNSVYDLTIETDHCYYANGYLVSNSDALRYLAVGMNAINKKSKSIENDYEAIRKYFGG